jgi:hypothetical protein
VEFSCDARTKRNHGEIIKTFNPSVLVIFDILIAEKSRT